MIRILLLRAIFPSITKQPATVALSNLYTSRTSTFASYLLLYLWFQHTFHRALDFFNSIVNNRIGFNFHAFIFCQSCLLAVKGVQLKPTIIASDAVASNTSLSVICPTPLCTTLTAISSVDNFCNESLNASTEPSTSPLIIRFSSLKLPKCQDGGQFHPV